MTTDSNEKCSDQEFSEAVSPFQTPSILIINEEVNHLAVKAKDSLEKKKRSSLGSKQKKTMSSPSRGGKSR